jgi:hypothetical protein
MKVTKAQFGELPAWMKKMFKATIPEGKTEADAEEYDNGEHDEDVSGLKAARDRERDSAKKLREEKIAHETRIQELEDQIEEGAGSKHSKDEEVTRIKEKAARDLQKAKADAKAKEDKLTGLLRKTHVDNVAAQLATEISTVPDLMKHEIARLLSVNLDGDEPTTEVLGPDGKPTARTLQELKQDFLGNPKYAAILVGSKGSGGGAGGGGNGGGAFDIKAYRNEDGTTNWTKVHAGMKDDPTVLDKVRAANVATPPGAVKLPGATV